MYKFDPKDCKHEHFSIDYFSRDFRINRGAPGHHICADCGSFAREIKPRHFEVFVDQKLLQSKCDSRFEEDKSNA